MGFIEITVNITIILKGIVKEKKELFQGERRQEK